MTIAAAGRRSTQASGDSDEDVVRHVLAGDVARFEVLMRRHNQRVYRAIRAVLRRDAADVEDAMQQTYLQAYRALGAFEGASSFGTWLTRIALNVALGVVRRQRVAGVAPAEVDDMTRAAVDEGPEGLASRREAAELLERAVGQLQEEHRVVFMLREVEQLSTAATAEALGLSEENVKVRLHRARLALRDLLAEAVGRSAPEAFTFLAPRCDRVVHAVLSAIGVPLLDGALRRRPIDLDRCCGARWLAAPGRLLPALLNGPSRPACAARSSCARLVDAIARLATRPDQPGSALAPGRRNPPRAPASEVSHAGRTTWRARMRGIGSGWGRWLGAR